MNSLVLAVVTVALTSQSAWGASPGEEAPVDVVNLLVNVIPWVLVFLFIWFFVFRKLKAGVVDREKIEQNLKRSMEHMERTEQQNQRMIQLLEVIAKQAAGVGGGPQI